MRGLGPLSKYILICVFSAVTLSCMTCFAGAARIQEPGSGGESLQELEQPSVRDDETLHEQYEKIIVQLQQQRSLFTREMAQIKREIAVLRESLSEPGLKEIFAGIGYILGLIGIAFYVQSRKSGKDS